MHELEKQNSALIVEADQILYEYGLLRIIEKYGTPFITGSYTLGMMTRRDLDVNIETDDMTVKRFFHLGGEIVSALNPRRVLFMNEFISRHQRFPLGLYFGVQTAIPGCKEEWNIDIWAMNTKQNKGNRQFIAELHSDIDEKKRRLILEIKTKSLEHPGYQRKFFSLDIYNAVTKDGIKTAEEFFQWVKEYRNTDLSV
ncbi:hypothetical protein ES703_74867 [subsurface metagenome]